MNPTINSVNTLLTEDVRTLPKFEGDVHRRSEPLAWLLLYVGMYEEIFLKDVGRIRSNVEAV